MTTTNPCTTDVLPHMVATLLTPMFLTATGNLDQAYAAAMATVRSCTARNPMDLIVIAQMIAFGLAALSALSLSMEENIPINQALRLRGNAVSLHRASDKCRRALPDPDPARDTPHAEAQSQYATEIIAEVERTAPEASADFPLDAPESLDEMKATMACIVAGSEWRTGKPKAAVTGAPFNAEKIMRATWAEAFPDATQEEIDAVIEEAFAESPPTAFTPPLGATPPPPG
jgi:hypothetical protein